MDLVKKITFNYFANTKLKEDRTTSIGDKALYPLYLDIVNNRQHLQIKSAVDRLVEPDFKEDDCKFKGLLKIEKDLITRIIRYEEKYVGDSYSLSGIGRRYNNYRASIYTVINDLRSVIVRNAIRKSDSKYFNLKELEKKIPPADKLYMAAKSLINNFNNYFNSQDFEENVEIWNKYFTLYPISEIDVFKFPMFLDWLEDRHYQEFKKHLIKGKAFNRDVIDQHLDHINTIIRLATIGH